MDKALVHEINWILYDDFQRRFIDSTVPLGPMDKALVYETRDFGSDPQSSRKVCRLNGPFSSCFIK